MEGSDLNPVFAAERGGDVRRPQQLERHLVFPEGDRHAGRVHVEPQRVHAEKEPPRVPTLVRGQEDAVRMGEDDLPGVRPDPVTC